MLYQIDSMGTVHIKHFIKYKIHDISPIIRYYLILCDIDTNLSFCFFNLYSKITGLIR